MKAVKKVLTFLLTTSMALMLMPIPTALAADDEYDVSNATELSEALTITDSVYTIHLMANVNYPAGIVITGKTITFNLDGHNLNVTNDTSDGLQVGSGGVVNIEGSGEFNVTSNAEYGIGVYAYDGGNATVTNATATGDWDTAVYAKSGGHIRVTGNAVSIGTGGTGVYLLDADSVIQVGGDAIATGADSQGISSEDGMIQVGRNTSGTVYGIGINGGVVEVAGNVNGGNGGWGVYADNGGKIKVDGNIHVTDGTGVTVLTDGSEVSVKGDVTANGTDCVGVDVFDGGFATIDGAISAPTYIMLQHSPKTISDGVVGTGDYENYLIYSDGSSLVRAKFDATCEVGTVQYPTLDAALNAAVSGDTIKLLKDIDYPAGIIITGKTITFNLNGHNLNVTSNTSDGLQVGSGGVVNIEGSGEFNVTSNAEDGIGVYAYDGGQATVTNATATGDWDTAVYAKSGGRIRVIGDAVSTGTDGTSVILLNLGTDSVIQVEGDAIATGANSQSIYGEEGIVQVSGNASATTYGIGFNGGVVEVAGNVNISNGGYGVYADNGAKIKVNGNIHVTDGTGITVLTDGSEVSVKGDVTANGTDCVGVNAFDGGLATIEGTINAPTYIMLQHSPKTISDGVVGMGDYQNYLVYTDTHNNTVRVKHHSDTTPVYYAITASANNASYGTVSGGGTYADGAAVGLTAIPGAGCRFIRWTKGGVEVSRNQSLAFTATENAGYTAEFVRYSPLAVSCSKTDNAVYGGANGTITVYASGGDSGYYEYSINSGASWQAGNVFYSLSEGSYTVTVRDAGYPGNTAVQSVVIGQPASIGAVAAKKLPSRSNAGTALTITPPVAPKGYTVVSITYSSSNPVVATVDASGNITFLAGGKATIITKIVSQMTDSKGRVKTKTTTVKKTVTVKQPVASISLSQYNATIMRTQKLKLTASVAPSTASNRNVKWTTSNKRAATVSSSGVITAKGVGTAVITCTAKDGSNISASCTVTVTPIYPTAVKISKTATTVKAGKTATLKATVMPKNTDFKAVVWQSSDPAVATVDAKGKIRGIAPGIVTITATTSNGIITACTVTVQ